MTEKQLGIHRTKPTFIIAPCTHWFRYEMNGLDELAGIENPVRVKRMFHRAMQFAHFFRDGQGPPALFGEADAVFAGDRAAPGQDLVEQLIQSSPTAPFGAGLIEIYHDVGVDVAVAGVTETGNRKTVLSLQPGGESEEVFQAATRNDDIFV